MATYIYSRVSTDGQSHDPQVMALRQKYPDAEVVTEIRSGRKSRLMLQALVDQLLPGDTLVVAALDRLGRKTTDILSLIDDLQSRQIILISVREGVDYSTPIGKLVTQILASVAEMERNLISERTKAGLDAARAKGVQIGRKPSIDKSVFDDAASHLRKGKSLRKAAKLVGISPTYLAKYIKTHKIEIYPELVLQRQTAEEMRIQAETFDTRF